MKTFKILRHITEADASPMIKPPKNEFGKKEDAFAHAKQHGGKVMKKTFTHPTSGMQTVSYVVREDTEQIDELKRTTLANYVSKAAGSYGRDKQNIGRESPDGTVAKARPELKRAVKNRLTGINRAAERLAKEEIEIDEASKKPNATTRHLRQYPVSDKDMAKPITYYSLVHKATNKVLSTHKDLESAKDEHRGMDQGERAHYRIATTTKAPKSFSMKEDAAEGLNEMDKSAPQPGRDGKISHSTYGSRDKEGSDYFKGKEVPVKPITVKKMEKDALDILKKQGVAEAVPFSYGAKPPRKGSVAYNALMKRKEQDKKRVKEIEAIGTKNHHIGVAKVTKEDIEDVAETYKYIDQSGGQVIKGKSGTYVGYTHSATKGKGANILKHNQTKKYYAAGGSSTAFTQKTTLHDTPQAAAKAYHKGNLAEQDEKETQEYDYEGDMARSDLRSIINNAQEVHDMLEANTNLPEWVQSKITLAEDYVATVRNYMKSENMAEANVWDKPSPNKPGTNKMTPDQRAEAKKRAKAAGRPYPNLVDNMAAMK